MAGQLGSQISEFFQEILRDLYTSLYLSIGGDLGEETRDWGSRAVDLASTGIKIIILLAILSFFYWLATYVIKHNKERLKLSDRRINIARSAVRYIWLVGCIIAVMSQISVDPITVKATAKASIWAGLYYIWWSTSDHLINRILNHYGLNASIEQLLQNIMSVLIIVLGLASVMAQFGFDIVSLVAGLGIVGLAVGFAAQSTLANFIAGLTILMEQSFQVGDWIGIGDKEGRVILISLRTTHILTRDNITVIVPNSTVASSEIVNLTSKQFIRFDTRVRIALEADIAAARNVILEVIKDMDTILDRPIPSASVTEISDFGVIFIVRFWVKPGSVAKLPRIREDLNEQIKIKLQKAGIAIPYPHMSILLPPNSDNNNYPIASKSPKVADGTKSKSDINAD